VSDVHAGVRIGWPAALLAFCDRDELGDVM
jgi:hypothetical protein